MLAMEPIRFRYIVDCIHSEIFFWKKCNSENMVRNVAAQFPPELELQSRGTWRLHGVFPACHAPCPPCLPCSLELGFLQTRRLPAPWIAGPRGRYCLNSHNSRYCPNSHNCRYCLGSHIGRYFVREFLAGVTHGQWLYKGSELHWMVEAKGFGRVRVHQDRPLCFPCFEVYRSLLLQYKLGPMRELFQSKKQIFGSNHRLGKYLGYFKGSSISVV